MPIVSFADTLSEADVASSLIRPSAPVPGGDFSLESKEGTLSLVDMRGKIVVLYFGYTFCPDVCPTTLINLVGAARLMNEDLKKRTEIVFVSVDPERDTPDSLDVYLSFFELGARGVTSSKDVLMDVVSRYGARYEKVATKNGGYSVDHTTAIALIDKRGVLRFLVKHDASPVHINYLIGKLDAEH